MYGSPVPSPRSAAREDEPDLPPGHRRAAGDDGPGPPGGTMYGSPVPSPRSAAQEDEPDLSPGHQRAAGDDGPGPPGQAEEDAELRGQIQELWRQEQEIQRELREMRQDQQSVLQAVQDLRSASDGSSFAESHARPDYRHRHTTHSVASYATSGTARSLMVKSPTKSKMSMHGYSRSATQDAIARRMLYGTGRKMKDNVIIAAVEASWDVRLSSDPSQGSGVSIVRGASWVSGFCRRLTRSQFFDVFVGLVIVANSLCIGTSLQWELEGRDISTLEIVEYVFLGFYVAELGVRLAAWGRLCFRNSWFIFDFVLVSVGVFADWILPPFLALMDNEGQLGFLEQVLIVRILRLLRLVRALRALELFKDMWKLARGMMGSARTVISACLLIFGSLYLFGCIGVEFLTQDGKLRDDPRTALIMERHFSSLPRVILTLVQFANYDSIASIYVPIIKVRPALCVYFVLIILVVPVCLMNLVTAVIVEHAIECAQTDAHLAHHAMRKRLKDLKPQIKQVFKDLDTSGDGRIQFSEIDFDHISIPDDLRDIIQPALLSDLFEFLDLDGSGELDEKEFETGVCHLALSSGTQGASIENTQMLQLLRQQLLCIGDLHERVRFLHERGMLACLREMDWSEAGSRGLRTRATRRSESRDLGRWSTHLGGRAGTPVSTAAPKLPLYEAQSGELLLDSDLDNDEPPGRGPSQGSHPGG